MSGCAGVNGGSGDAAKSKHSGGNDDDVLVMRSTWMANDNAVLAYDVYNMGGNDNVVIATDVYSMGDSGSDVYAWMAVAMTLFNFFPRPQELFTPSLLHGPR